MKEPLKKIASFLYKNTIPRFKKIKKNFKQQDKLFYFAALTFCLLEVTIFGRFKLFGVKPNLLLFLITFYCYYFSYDFFKIIFFILFCALLKDLFSLDYFGTNLFIFLLLGNLVSFFSRRFSRFNWYFIVLLFLLSIVTEGVLYFAIQRIIFNNNVSLLRLLFRTSLWEFFYTFLLFLIFFRVIKKCVIDKLS